MIEADGTLVAETRERTPYDSDALIDVLTGIVIELVDTAGPVDAVGVGVPGLITLEGVLRSSPNVPTVTELDVAGRLGERLGRQVAVSNDATCAALAEWRTGAGRGVDDMVMVTLGTGIGGGWSPPAASSSAPTASPASSGTWSSTPTARRACAAVEGAGSVTPRAPASPSSRGRRPSAAGCAASSRSPAVTPGWSAASTSRPRRAKATLAPSPSSTSSPAGSPSGWST